MDVLSDVLRVVRLSGAVFFTARLSPPWATASPPSDELSRLLRLPGECTTLFHVLVEGGCWIDLPGHPPFEVRAGDVVVFPRGDAHVMGSGVGLPPLPITAILPFPLPEGVFHVNHAGDGSASRFICGYLHCDQRFNPLMGMLPPVLLVRKAGGKVRVGSPTDASDQNGQALRSSEATWFENTLRFVIEETDRRHPGGSALLARLAEILFVGVLRAYMEQMPSTQRGWLAGVQDAEVGRALQLLHAHPERKWTVEDLAEEVGRSRSALAERFAGYVGAPPMRYLAQWRMQLAKHLLRQPGLNMAEVATHVGYDAEAAFSRAFKRHVGEPPAAWRAAHP